MSIASQLSFIAFTCITPFYLYAALRFYGIVKAEKPEWLQVRGSLSFFYDGLPRVGDPNVQVELLRVIFGPRSHQLQAPMAATYVTWIRILLPVCLALFAVGLVGATLGAP
jgi:hypothetical protein